MNQHHPVLRRGKAPARPGAMKLKLSDYVDRKAFPKAPASFGHDDLIHGDWGMLANDSAGCCVWSGAGHETMLWNRIAGRAVSFTPANVLSDYSAVTGYDPAKPDTDQGTDMVAAAAYRQKTGIVDAAGNRHKIAAYLALDPGNLDDLWVATYLFGAVGIGLALPPNAEDQFDAGQEWTYVKGDKPTDGHYVPLLGKIDNTLRLVTWGRVQTASVYYYQEFGDEAVAFLSDEDLIAQKSPEGFDYAALTADLAMIKGRMVNGAPS